MEVLDLAHFTFCIICTLHTHSVQFTQEAHVWIDFSQVLLIS